MNRYILFLLASLIFFKQVYSAEIIEIEGHENLINIKNNLLKLAKSKNVFADVSNFLDKSVIGKEKVLLGELLFNLDNDYEKNFKICGKLNGNHRQCSYGVIASFAKGIKSKKIDLMTLPSAICIDSFNVKNTKEFKKMNKLCSHAIGHFLFEYLNENIQESLKICESLNLGEKNNLGFCASGVFNRYFITRSISKLSLKDYYQYPCIQTNKYLALCLKYKFSYASDTSLNWQKNYNTFCENYGNQAKDCYEAVGGAIFSKERNLSKACLLGDLNLRWSCYRPILNVIAVESSKPYTVNDTCNQIKEKKLQIKCQTYLEKF